MSDVFTQLIAGFLVLLVYLWSARIVAGLLAKETPPAIEPPVVQERFGKIVGKYKDLDIHEFVKTMDGRVFTFESLAIELSPNTYDMLILTILSLMSICSIEKLRSV